jgi:ABC-type glycerol-3-phosphate transport system substrate-binding protein
VAAFLNFLSSSAIQAKWHQDTGYLPITMAAYDETKASGYYDENPGTDIAIIQMTGKAPTSNSKGLRLGSFDQIRGIIDEELEGVWNGDEVRSGSPGLGCRPRQRTAPPLRAGQPLISVTRRSLVLRRVSLLCR